MVVVILIAIFASLAMPGLLNNTKDLAVYQAAQRVAEVVQSGRSRALATGSAHAIAFSRTGAPAGRVGVQQAQRTIGTVPTLVTVPVNSCRTPGAFNMNVGSSPVTATVVAPITSPLTDQLVFETDARLRDYNIQMVAFRGPAAPGGGEMWFCFTPTGRAYIGANAGALAAAPALITPVMVDIARIEGAARVGLTRSVVITPGSAPRIFSSQL